MRARWIGRGAGVVTAQVVHVPLLLLPTFLLSGPRGMEWSTICLALAVVMAAVLEGLFVTQRFVTPDDEVHDHVAVKVACFVGICLLGIFWSSQVEQFIQGSRSLPLHCTGGALLLVGIALRMLAIQALGNQFISDIQVGSEIVRDGIYAWLRHPSEIGLLLIAAGGPLLVGAPLTAITALLLLLPISLWRMRREDLALALAARSPSKASHGRLSAKVAYLEL